jgi:ParB-like nuclease domain
MQLTYSPKLVPSRLLSPALYNPRETDPYRLKLIVNSLTKLGWLLPLYAIKNKDGMFDLISGHQRTLAAELLKYDMVPLVEMPDLDINKRKAVNILFNRGTNDFSITQGSIDALSTIDANQYDKTLSLLPDKKNAYPCMTPEVFDLKSLWDVNKLRSINYARNTARALCKNGVMMPLIVCRQTLEVSNGIGRLQYLLEKGFAQYNVVFIDEVEAEFAKISLNLISMNFTLEKHYENHLRFSSFRRSRNTRNNLGRGFVFRLIKGRRLEDFDITKIANQEKWQDTYGKTVLDFGAGHLTESDVLSSIGVKVTSFEPYRCIKGVVSKKHSILCIDKFLDDVEKGVDFDSIFISSVLNSVPFRKDREAIIQICSALSSKKTVLYIATMHKKHSNYYAAATSEAFNKKHSEMMTFKLEYKDGIILGDFNESPKVQKYHTNEELYEVIKTGYNTVSVDLYGDTCCARAKGPIWTKEALRASLEFEFELPYPDGSTMGMSKRAIAAFEKRLGIKL